MSARRSAGIPLQTPACVAPPSPLQGIAHLLEHMAFKGTERVGTRDYAREAPLLDAMDEVFYSLRDDGGNARQRARLQDQLKALQAQVRRGARASSSGGARQASACASLGTDGCAAAPTRRPPRCQCRTSTERSCSRRAAWG